MAEYEQKHRKAPAHDQKEGPDIKDMPVDTVQRRKLFVFFVIGLGTFFMLVAFLTDHWSRLGSDHDNHSGLWKTCTPTANGIQCSRIITSSLTDQDLELVRVWRAFAVMGLIFMLAGCVTSMAIIFGEKPAFTKYAIGLLSMAGVCGLITMAVFDGQLLFPPQEHDWGFGLWVAGWVMALLGAGGFLLVNTKIENVKTTAMLGLAGVGVVCLIAATGSKYWNEGDGGFPHVGLWEQCTASGCFQVSSDMVANGAPLDSEVWAAWRVTQAFTLLALIVGGAAVVLAFPVVFARQVKWKNYVTYGMLIAAFCGVIAMAVWKTKVIDEVYASHEVGYSYILLALGWALLFFGGLGFIGVDKDVKDAKLMLHFIVAGGALLCYTVALSSNKWGVGRSGANTSLGLFESCALDACSEIDFDAGLFSDEDAEARLRAAQGFTALCFVLNAVAALLGWLMVFKKRVAFKLPIMFLMLASTFSGCLALAVFKLGLINEYLALSLNLGYSFYMAGAGALINFFVFLSYTKIESKVTNFKAIIFYILTVSIFLLNATALSGIDWLSEGLFRFGVFEWCLTNDCASNNDDLETQMDAGGEFEEIAIGWRVTQATMTLTTVLSFVSFVVASLFVLRGSCSKVLYAVLHIVTGAIGIVAVSVFRGIVVDKTTSLDDDNLDESFMVAAAAAAFGIVVGIASFKVNIGNGAFAPPSQQRLADSNSQEEMQQPNLNRAPSRPENVPPPQKAYDAPTQLPPGWVQYQDQDTGIPYYFNQDTGASSWEPPR